MTIKFLRVLGLRSSQPSVLATVADETGAAFVRWDRRRWTCDCDAEGDQCPHVDAVADLLDPRVLGDAG